MIKKLRVVLLGEPNAGKSSLANRFLSRPVCVISARPHSTREPTLAVYRDESHEIVFIDTPGIGRSSKKDSIELAKMATDSLREADLALFLIDSTKKIPPLLMDISHNTPKKIAILTKTDLVNKGRLLPLTFQLSQEFSKILSLSSVTGKGFDYLLEELKSFSYEGEEEFLGFDTNRSNLALLKDRVKEVLFEELQGEIPYKLKVEVPEMFTKKSQFYIYIDLICLKSQKPILLGKIKQLSVKIRERLESFLQKKVHSFLNVKVS